MARFVVGIDLGTTNCALAYAPLETSESESATLAASSRSTGRPADATLQTLSIPQTLEQGETGTHPTLPSFLYHPAEGEFPPRDLNLPWDPKPGRILGRFARDHGAKSPLRLISSAKSWLCHPEVDSQTALLPWHAPEEIPKLSPVAASSAYLAHLRDAWNHQFGVDDAEARLESQEVYLTVPASFDAVARELTLEAARDVGLNRVTLLEEPQAAFYAWLTAQGDAWRDQVKVGDVILVCDVGGGTTDLTLIQVQDEDGSLTLNRLAVGDHILLGGDNMDLALAYNVANQLSGGMESLDPSQRVALIHACRDAKEALFRDESLKKQTITILGKGMRLIGGTKKVPLERSLLKDVLIDGFLPICGSDDEPVEGLDLGLTEIGLPYASDPAITRHLAAFLRRQGGSVDGVDGMIRPNAILFNGGVFRAQPLRDRIVEVLRNWSGTSIVVLPGNELDLAVARGAAHYGLVRRGRGIRIRGGVPRAYYIGIQRSAMAVPGIPPSLKALCVVPMGMEEGTDVEIPRSEFHLVLGKPTSFRFFGSSTRRQDQPGDLLETWEPDELQELAPLRTELRSDSEDASTSKEAVTSTPSRTHAKVPVRLHSQVTEVGTLDLWCQSTREAERRWKLQFHVRRDA